MDRRNLTDRFIKSRRPAAIGQRDEYADAQVPGLYLRVTDRGHKSFALVTRYPLTPKHPTRRSLGGCDEINLADAREKARDWLKLIGKGIDPKVDEERQRAAQLRRQANTFEAVAREFLALHAAKLAKRSEAEAIIGNEFMQRWAQRPITDITTLDVSTAIRAIVDRGSPYQAHNAFGHIRKMFRWTIATGMYGIEASPVDRLSPRDLIGKKESRSRTLDDDELRWVWQAADQLGYPYGPLVRMLILTGQRKSQVAEMPRSEADLDKATWIIPKERMKADAAHMVPLAPLARALLESLQAWPKGDFVFTTTEGEAAVNGFSKAKARLDKLVEARREKTLGADVARKKPMPAWTFQDLRRTMRTHLSALPVQDLVRELVIAHAKPGLHKVYDLYAYADEKRQCLELWERRLLAIVEPPPAAKVVPIGTRREKMRR
jgi:integrase